MIDLRRRQQRIMLCSLDAPLRREEDGHALSCHEFVAPDSDPEQIVVGPILEEQLQQALKALPAEYRTAILLCDLEQRSYQEIAEAMHCAIGTVRSRIHRARVMLVKRLTSGGPGEADIDAWQRSRLPRTAATRGSLMAAR